MLRKLTMLAITSGLVKSESPAVSGARKTTSATRATVQNWPSLFSMNASMRQILDGPDPPVGGMLRPPPSFKEIPS